MVGSKVAQLCETFSLTVALLLLLQGWQGHVDRQLLPVPVTPLLSAAADLVLSFRQCLDVVVSVSRKTDASLWPALFSAVGSPAAILEMLLDTGALSSAACFLIVVDRWVNSWEATCTPCSCRTYVALVQWEA